MKFEITINFHNKILHVFFLLLGDSSKSFREVKNTLHDFFSLNLSLLLAYTAIIVVMMLYYNAYLFPIRLEVL